MGASCRRRCCEGDGKQVRFIRFDPGATIPEDEIAILLAEAIALKA